MSEQSSNVSGNVSGKDPGTNSSRVVRWGLVAWSMIGLLILAYIVIRFVLVPVRIVFGPLLVAAVIVYLLNPIVSRLQSRGIPRVWGALITYVVFLSILGIGLRFLIPVLANQITGFAKAVPSLLEGVQRWANDLSTRFGVDPKSIDIVDTLSPGGSAGEFIGRIFSFTAGLLHVLVVLILGIVLSFYLLVDLPKIRRNAILMVPAGRRAEVRTVLARVSTAVGGFLRGQLVVALFVGLASMLGLYIVGLPYWALVGGIAGLFNLIPLVGPFIGAIPALFIAFTTNDTTGLLKMDPGWAMALGSAAALTIVQQIDNHIISPNVVARTVKLHPVSVMLGLLVGGTWLGLVGMLVAVPMIATIKIVLLHIWDTRTQWPPKASTPSEPVDEEEITRRVVSAG
jgi:predicted PurR-regulated permease PerM